jgi:alpha,alpha-trehalase
MTRGNAEQRVKIVAHLFDAAIFDMDGVVTQTAVVHAAAWKQMFDEYLTERKRAGEPPFKPFDVEADYRLYVDGKPRYDGVMAFLAARGISIPFGNPDDSPDTRSVCGLGNRKDLYFLHRVHKEGVKVHESTIELIRQLKVRGVKVGIFSASRNAPDVLSAARVIDLFDDRIDGAVAGELGLPGKPHPAVLIELTRRLGAAPSRTAVFEDAIAGVQAGRAGDFALVVGVNRGGRPGALVENGADIEVTDLSRAAVVP